MLQRRYRTHYPLTPRCFPHSSCLLRRSHTEEKLWVCIILALQFQLCYHHVEQGPDLVGTEHSLMKNMRMECLIHRAFETFLKCIVILFCLQREQSQLCGNSDMEIFRVVMTVKLLQSSEIRILGVSSQT